MQMMVCTQDTVIGLQALAEFAAKTSFMGSDSVDVKITWDSQSHDFDTITRSNADVLQQYEVSLNSIFLCVTHIQPA